MPDRDSVGVLFCGLAVQAAGCGPQLLQRLAAKAAEPGSPGPGERCSHDRGGGGIRAAPWLLGAPRIHQEVHADGRTQGQDPPWIQAMPQQQRLAESGRVAPRGALNSIHRSIQPPRGRVGHGGQHGDQLGAGSPQQSPWSPSDQSRSTPDPHRSGWYRATPYRQLLENRKISCSMPGN